MKKISIKYLLLSVLAIFVLLSYLLHPPAYIPDTFAQSPCGTSNQIKATGLVATPKITGSFVTSSGACVVNPRAGFAPFKIPSYADFKSLYYDQSKANKAPPINASITDATQTSLDNATQDTVYYVSGTSLNGNLTLSGNPSTTTTPSPTLVVFVDGNLNINENYTYGSPTTGTVFIVKGDVNIAPSPAVLTINAVIISAGTIFTSGAGCLLPPPATSGTDSQLTVTGSLISLTDTKPPKFCRKLADNTQPAEKINHQVKYVVILRNLMSDTLQRWSEIP